MTSSTDVMTRSRATMPAFMPLAIGESDWPKQLAQAEADAGSSAKSPARLAKPSRMMEEGILRSFSAYCLAEPARWSRTGFQPVSPGILPAEETGAGSPED